MRQRGERPCALAGDSCATRSMERTGESGFCTFTSSRLFHVFEGSCLRGGCLCRRFFPPVVHVLACRAGIAWLLREVRAITKDVAAHIMTKADQVASAGSRSRSSNKKKRKGRLLQQAPVDGPPLAVKGHIRGILGAGDQEERRPSVQ